MEGGGWSARDEAQEEDRRTARRGQRGRGHEDGGAPRRHLAEVRGAVGGGGGVEHEHHDAVAEVRREHRHLGAAGRREARADNVREVTRADNVRRGRGAAGDPRGGGDARVACARATSVRMPVRRAHRHAQVRTRHSEDCLVEHSPTTRARRCSHRARACSPRSPQSSGLVAGWGGTVQCAGVKTREFVCISVHLERSTPMFEPANTQGKAPASTGKLGRIGRGQEGSTCRRCPRACRPQFCRRCRAWG